MASASRPASALIPADRVRICWHPATDMLTTVSAERSPNQPATRLPRQRFSPSAHSGHIAPEVASSLNRVFQRREAWTGLPGFHLQKFVLSRRMSGISINIKLLHGLMHDNRSFGYRPMKKSQP